MPDEAGFGEYFRYSPVAVLAIFQGSRLTIAAPNWVKLAAEKRVFWQPRTMMIEVMTTCARQDYNSQQREDIFNWAVSVSVSDNVHIPVQRQWSYPISG